MNKHSTQYRSEASEVGSNVIPCSLLVSEKHLVPINHVEKNGHASAWSDGSKNGSVRSIFIAPTFAEMMQDSAKLEAVLQAIAAHAEIQSPRGAVWTGQETNRVALWEERNTVTC